MSKLSRRLHLIAALLSLSAAIVLVVHVGLPKRADFIGIGIDRGSAVAPEAGFAAPHFILQSVTSGPLALAQTYGTVTIINFWATWCEPCRREMRELQELYDDYPGDLRILAVNVGESARAVQEWVDELSLTFDVLLDPPGKVSTLYQVRGLPTTFVLDGSQIMQSVHFGPLRAEQLHGYLARLGGKA